MDRVGLAKQALSTEAYFADDSTGRFFYYTRLGGDLPDDPIRALVASAGASEVGIMPVYVDKKLTQSAFWLAVICISHNEHAQVLRGALQLPDGWDIAIEFFPGSLEDYEPEECLDEDGKEQA